MVWAVRRAVTVVLYPLWLVGVCAASIYALLRWAWAAAADGADSITDRKWAPALGAGLIALAVVAVIVAL